MTVSKLEGPKYAQKCRILCSSHIAINNQNMLQSTENITKYAQNILPGSCRKVELT